MTKATLDRRGAIAAVSAVVMVFVVGFAGLAIDLSRIWLLSARLKSATDAASLIAARTMTSTTTNGVTTTTTDVTATRALFWANFHQNGWSNAYLGATTEMPTIEAISETRIRVTATASINTTLFSIIARHTTPLSETTVAEREGGGLELAIVLDQTSSMLASATGYTTKLAAAQAAVVTMLGQLYGGSDTARNLFVSVVPFARTINVGTGNSNFLNTANMPTEWNLANWSGCVEARRSGEDITDISPATSAGQFRPYFNPNTYRRVGWASTNGPSNTVVALSRNATTWYNLTGTTAYSGNGACTSSDQQAYGAVSVTLYTSATGNNTTTYNMRFCRGDNDTGNASLSTTYASNSTTWNPMYAYLRGQGFTGRGNLATSAAGPNMLCAMNAILPLTASRTTVQAAVNAIQAPDKSGGTTVAAGMQGAWYTLSPNWQSWWTGIATSATLGTLPLAYNTRNMTKAVVILTDGDNNWQLPYGCSSTNCSGSSTSSYIVQGNPAVSNELLYNAYGRASAVAANYNATSINLGTRSSAQTNADAWLDTRFASICAAMKNSTSTNPAEHAIRIYVIGFEVANAQRSMLQACASSTTAPYYLEAPSASDLQSAFSQVANSLSSLRLIE